MARISLIAALALLILSCAPPPELRSDSRNTVSPLDQPIASKLVAPKSKDSNPNLAKRIKIERVWLERGKDATGSPSWLLAVRWRNKTGKTVSEVWVNATITDKDGLPLEEWSDNSWELFDEDFKGKQRQVKAGEAHTTRIYVANIKELEAFGEPMPSKAKARVIAGYEKQHDLYMTGEWKPPGYNKSF